MREIQKATSGDGCHDDTTKGPTRDFYKKAHPFLGPENRRIVSDRRFV